MYAGADGRIQTEIHYSAVSAPGATLNTVPRLHSFTMGLLTLANVSCAFGTQIVLDAVTVSIERGEKIGLIGRNGCGKTTLMRVMQGDLQPDAGTVQLARGAVVGYLRQDPDFAPDETVRDAAEGAFAKLHQLHLEIDAVYHDMAEASGEQLDRMLTRQARLETEMEAAGGYAVNHRIEASLHGLGFTDEQMDLKTSVLSGGQLSRLGLSRLLLEEPDLLLLDEPTNHLDIDGRKWLEQFLAEEYRGAVIVVSHDRWLLDRVVDRIVEIDRGRVLEYPGNYHTYVALRDQQRLTHRRTYEKQLDRIRQEEQYIRRYKAGQRARQAKGREAKLDRFKADELVDRPVELDVMHLSLPPAPRSGDLAIAADCIGKRYGDTVLFENLSMSLTRGDRLGIIGPNGAGKTTLVNCLLGDLAPDTGSVRLGSRISVGYYRQIPRDLDLSMEVWRYLQSVIVSLDGRVRASEQQARDLAGAFLFSGIEQDKTLGDLSGGERSRAVIAGLVAGAHNLLVLDEPSNHLDIPSAERLEQSLASSGGYEGTLILVTHDRALIDATCDQLLVLDGAGGARHFPGTYSQWLARADAMKGSLPGGVATDAPAPRSRRKPKPAAVGDSTESRLTIERLEQRIETAQQRIGEIDRQLIKPDVYTNGERCRSLQTEREALGKQLQPLETEWARRAGNE